MTTFILRPELETRTRHQAGSNRWVSRFFTLSAAVIVLIIHLLWVLAAAGYHPENRAKNHRMAAPEIYFMSDNPDHGDAAASTDARLIRSPILMSLPTSVGFSGPLIQNARLDQPPRFIEKPVEFLRQLPQPFEAGEFGESLRRLKQLSSTPRTINLPEREPLPPDVIRPMDQSSGRVLMYWLNHPEQGVETIPGEQDIAWAGDQPWESMLYVCFDRDGWVNHVMIEKPASLKTVNDRVLRMTRGRGHDGAMADKCDWLVVKFIPASTGGDK